MKVIREETIKTFKDEMYFNEKSEATISKYVSIIQRLAEFLDGEEVTKSSILRYRDKLQETLKPQTVNGAVSAINAFLEFCGWKEAQVKLLKVQRQAFLDEERELSDAEYRRLLFAAKEKGNERLYMLMMVVCGTGICISELKYITVEAAEKGRAEIHMKGKSRIVILPKELRKKLLQYAKKYSIYQGHIFRTKTGRAMDRSNICHEMKKLCAAAGVEPRKVFPHNLRHLFARTFYSATKNLAHLADVLGHSRIETTRIYVAVSTSTHERILDRMKLVI